MDDKTVVERVLEQATAHNFVGTPASPVEHFFDSLGMMRGSMAPMYRGLFGFCAASALMWALRPGFAFDSEGARPWKSVSDDPDATRVPWFVPGIIAAGYFALFV